MALVGVELETLVSEPDALKGEYFITHCNLTSSAEVVRVNPLQNILALFFAIYTVSHLCFALYFLIVGSVGQ